MNPDAETDDLVTRLDAPHTELRGPSGNQEALCSCGWNGGLVTLWRDHAAAVTLVDRLDALWSEANEGNTTAFDQWAVDLHAFWPELRDRLTAAEADRDEAIRKLSVLCDALEAMQVVNLLAGKTSIAKAWHQAREFLARLRDRST